MKLLITGATGFIGQALITQLLAAKHDLIALSRRSPRHLPPLFRSAQVRCIQSLDEIDTEEPLDAIINLAGEPIADRRWSPARKQLLADSRTGTTKKLSALVKRLSTKPKTLISGSAVGYYGDQGNQTVIENTPPHDEFTHSLCHTWEQAALAMQEDGVRVCLVRTGLVIGPRGGFLKRMLLPFRLGLGGRLGDGRQWMSWIDLEDEVRIILFLLQHQELQGAFNATAPTPVTNRDFTRALASCVKRPACIPVPALLLKLILGEMSRLLLTGQKALPHRLLEAGFTFKQPDLLTSLRQSIKC